MYRDDNHLTVEGANYVWSRVRAAESPQHGPAQASRAGQ